MADAVRTRIPPSPTGSLHVGTARTALFNELFARHHEGEFIVRVEDTDRERSTKESEDNILEGLRWLGLTWEEGPDVGGPNGPYRQSERTSTYTAVLEQLVNEGRAYQREGEEVIVLRVEPGEIRFTDLIRGDVVVNTDAWGGDFVIARSMSDPLYHLAVVVDDAAMKVTHVIRGEDHLTNTARHILLQQALGLPQPHYAHLPLLLDEQRRKLSKRVGDVDLLAYRDRGFLPEAMVNYLALLGWNPKDDTEVFSRDELIKRFSLDGVQKGGAIFSEEKLTSLNKEHLKQLSPDEVLMRAESWLQEAGYDLTDRTYWSKAVATEQERVSTLAELSEALAFFKPDWAGEYPAERLVWRKSDAEATKQYLAEVYAVLEALSEDVFTEEGLEKELMAWIDAKEYGRGDVLWPLRVALTGREHSPGPFEVGSVLGKGSMLTRIDAALKQL